MGGLKEVGSWPEGTEGLAANGNEGGPGPPQNVYSIYLSPLSLSLVFSYGGKPEVRRRGKGSPTRTVW